MLVKAVAALMVVLLAGDRSRCRADFVGLVVPHIARFVVGVDYRWIIPYSMVLGGILVTVADVAARLVLRPQELPVGIMMAVLGAPFFIFLARWKVRR